MVKYIIYYFLLITKNVLERRAVYSFLDTLYRADDTNGRDERHRKSPSPRLSRRINTATGYSSQRRLQSNSRASKRDLGEILESLQRYTKSE
jgi:hypothetical protein